MRIFRTKLGPARCALDLGDGSERGEYVGQDYILRKIGRPHRSVSLMYCYYPLDEQWPARISDVVKSDDISFQWDYPYDDYFPYLGGLEGDTSGEPFASMRDIRRHGQDVALTLTIDPAVSDERLAAIGDDLRPFGRVFLRINHEATGNWFAFNKRASYQEVADFFVRASRIIKGRAPNVKTIICIGGVEDAASEKITREEEFAQAIREADIWSVDKYIALHWGWPFDVAEKGGNSHARWSPEEVYELVKRSFERFAYLNGGEVKPMAISEFNVDGDVTGPYEQAETVGRFFDIVESEDADWLKSVTLYQFRDRGRLGLEIQDPNDPEVGVEQPLMRTYREIANRERFLPRLTDEEEISLPCELRWRSSEDADGIALRVGLSGVPAFCELYFDDDSNLMIEAGGVWFYKAPETRFVDIAPAFFGKELPGETELTVRMFAPPATGENDLSAEDGAFVYRYTLEKLPRLRVVGEAVAPEP